MLNRPLQIFIVDDHQMVIEGIKALLQNETTITIIGYTNSAESCLEFFKTHTADVVLMDINLPEMSGVELCEMLLKMHKDIKIIALSSFSQGTYIRKMMENGAHGYLLKNANKFEIIEAIETVSQDEKYLTPEADKALKYELNLQYSLPKITKREKEVLVLIVEGFTNAQISEKLYISIDTVDSHRKNLYTKLNVSNTAKLISYASKNNLIE